MTYIFLHICSVCGFVFSHSLDVWDLTYSKLYRFIVWSSGFWQCKAWLLIRGLYGKCSTILNISRIGCVALKYLGIQSGETLQCICEHSHSHGASQSTVRRRWLSLCTVWPSHSQWPSEQISFIATLRLPILQLSCRVFFWQSIKSPRSVSPPTAQICLPATSGFSQS